ncbi:Sodium-dependent neutral amino acid transporter B(0)AT2 [Araneus ventricosus]|uniref:Sodium-dependent neutral amino acid transporter B(0)AT2 n=1 Tax=Araneus ventricosus TaxID=182803 RepID=A0A4Y2B2I0_ARAVE|nr:Sodium-dependent neutral amino acid transporter B(0)AT2 [Araneus ventricosus]
MLLGEKSCVFPSDSPMRLAISAFPRGNKSGIAHRRRGNKAIYRLEDRNLVPPGVGRNLNDLVVWLLYQLSASGTGLAFIAFTEAINQFPGAPFWSVLFFLMLFTLGIDSQFGTLEGVITSIVDMKLFPNVRKEILTGLTCLLCFFLSLIFSQGGGNYVFTLFDNYSGNFPLLIVAFFECIAISYIYGLKRFSDDIELMTGKRPNCYWLFCWKYVAPVAMVIILTASFVQIATEGSSYETWDKESATTVKQEWPGWCHFVITFLILVAAIWIPLVAFLEACGIHLLPPEEPSWFPAEELRDYHALIPHKVTDLEKCLFCMKDDEPEEM